MNLVLAASAHVNSAGIALLDRVAAQTGTEHKALVDQGFTPGYLPPPHRGRRGAVRVAQAEGRVPPPGGCGPLHAGATQIAQWIGTALRAGHPVDTP